jgi:2-oxoisovalerate dehydrogenase E2 component (dihydrolipoyl transacylase)
MTSQTTTTVVREFMLPDLGEGLEEAEIVQWHVTTGDQVSLNQTLVSVETAKAIVDIPSPFAGTVTTTVGEVGETLEVGTLLARIETVGDDDESDAPPAEPQTDGASAGGAPTAQEEGEPKLLVGYGTQEPEPSRRRRATGPVLAKPPARKLARDLSIDLASVFPGSGPQGAVTSTDVRRAAEAAALAQNVPSDGGQTARTPVAVRASPAGFRSRSPGEVEQVRGIRKRIIEKMEESRRDIPEALCHRDVDVTELWRLRDELTAAAAADGHPVRVTPMALICRATIVALRRFPTLNARYDQKEQLIRLLEPIHLGIAVDTDRGLMVPNLKDAHTLSTVQIAEQMADVADRCRSGAVKPNELVGGTFTVDNYGFFGTDVGDPIINTPEAAILGIGTMRERPWVIDGQLAVRRVATLTLAFDHRICDGGEAGRFLTYLAELCEAPTRILLHS